MFITLLVITVIAYFFDRILRFVIVKMFYIFSIKTKTTFDDFLVKSKFPRYIAHVIPLFILKFIVPVQHYMFCSFICILFCFVTNPLTTPKGMHGFLSNLLTSLNYNVLFICITISFVINPLTALKNNCESISLANLQCTVYLHHYIFITNSLTALKK